MDRLGPHEGVVGAAAPRAGPDRDRRRDAADAALYAAKAAGRNSVRYGGHPGPDPALGAPTCGPGPPNRGTIPG